MAFSSHIETILILRVSGLAFGFRRGMEDPS